MAQAKRPLSPHLQIYHWPVTMATSILHRATGVALGAGTLLLTWWLVAAASGPSAFADAQAFLSNWLGQLVLLGFSWSLIYHLFNGIRHLFWDAGMGFEIETANRTGWWVIVGSVVVTLIVWAAGYGLLGGGA